MIRDGVRQANAEGRVEVVLAHVDDLDGDVEGRGAQDERVVLEEFTRRRHIRDDYSQVGRTTAEDACNEGGELGVNQCICVVT